MTPVQFSIVFTSVMVFFLSRLFPVCGGPRLAQQILLNFTRFDLPVRTLKMASKENAAVSEIQRNLLW
jgi:hypothetical protein